MRETTFRKGAFWEDLINGGLRFMTYTAAQHKLLMSHEYSYYPTSIVIAVNLHVMSACAQNNHINIFERIKPNDSFIYPLPPAHGLEQGDQLFRAHSYVSSWMTLLLLRGTESSWMMYLYIKVDRVSLSLGIIYKSQEEREQNTSPLCFLLYSQFALKSLKCKLVQIDECLFSRNGGK